MRKFYTVMILTFLMVCSLFSIGIKIQPATFVIQNVEIGKTIDMYNDHGHILRIYGGNRESRYSIEPVKPSDSGTKITGYFDFPNPEFFWTELDTMTVPADISSSTSDDMADNPMYMKIPSNDNYYNRHYMLGVNVQPVLNGNSGNVVLGAYLQFRIETEAKTGVVPEVTGRDEIVFVPSVIELKDVEPGKEYLAHVKIYSGMKFNRHFDVKPLDPNSPVGKITILTSPGFKRVQEHSWLSYTSADNIGDDDNIKLKLISTSPTDLYISLFVPERQKEKRFEELLMIEGDTKSFLRIKFTMKDI